MLVMSGVVLLIAWLVAIFGLFWIGDWTHMILVASLFLLFLGGLRARDAAMGRDRFRI